MHFKDWLLSEEIFPNKPFAVFVLVSFEIGYAATTRAKDTGEEGRIGLPGGKVDENESPIQGAYREAKEEGWEVFDISPNPIQKKLVEGKMIWWYSAKYARMLTNYKEKGRISPVIASKEQIKNSGYGNETLPL